MEERKDTMVCTFTKESPRVSALDIHEWIHNKLQLHEQDVRMIQIDGIRRQVFIKVRDTTILENIIDNTNGCVTYEHTEGIISNVQINMAGIGRRRIRIANLPPEIAKTVIKDTIGQYGHVIDIQDEKWTGAYRYKVNNGIINATVDLKKHIPSHLTIKGHRALIDYEGQVKTCYVCNEPGHVVTQCPTREKQQGIKAVQNRLTWAEKTKSDKETTEETTTDLKHHKEKTDLHTTTRDQAQQQSEKQPTNEAMEVEDNTTNIAQVPNTDTIRNENKMEEEADNQLHELNQQAEEKDNASQRRGKLRRERTLPKDTTTEDTNLTTSSEEGQEENTHSIRIEGVKVKRDEATTQARAIPEKREEFPTLTKTTRTENTTTKTVMNRLKKPRTEMTKKEENNSNRNTRSRKSGETEQHQ